MNVPAATNRPSRPIPETGAVSVKGFGVTVTITRSDGRDGAVVVFVDTAFEPDTSPGLRVLVNDGDAYLGVPYRPQTARSEAGHG